MSSYLDYEGLSLYHENNKNYIDSKIPTKTSDLTNDNNFVNTNTLNTSLNTKAPKEHTHEISDVDGLQDELGNYASKTDIPTLVAGDNITLSTDADTNEITISSTGGGSGSVGTLEDLGVTATADELNYVDGVTSNIQTQLNNKVSIRRAIVGQNSSTTANPYYKFASITLTTTNTDAHISFRVQDRNIAITGGTGILTASIRQGSLGVVAHPKLVWEYANSGINPSDFTMCYKETSGTNIIVELYVKIDNAWEYFNFDVISEGGRSSSSTVWTLHSATSAGQSASLPSGYTTVTSSLIGILNPSGLVYSSTEPTTNLSTNMVWIG